MNLHKEVHFEHEIREHLAANGWLYAEGDAARYDRARALFPADVVAWVREVQAEAWKALEKNHGASAEAVLLDRLRTSLDERGALDVLRHGIDLLGLRRMLALAQFKPALGVNPDILARYAANRLRLGAFCRQQHGSAHDDTAGRAGNDVFAVQPGRPRRGG